MEIAYHGGLAAAGRIYFYEYSRASYGFARLLSTAEHFRRTGRVAQKIRTKNYVDLTTGAPKEGSFITEVLVPTIASSVPQLAGVSVKGMVAYIFQLLTPRSEATDATVIELAKIRLVEERKASGAPHADVIEALERIVETQTATTQQALELARYALASSNAAVARLHDDPGQYAEIIKELEAEQEQKNETQKIEQYLQVLDTSSVARLSSRVRPMITEMGLPLRKDIKSFTIGAANENKPLAYFNAARVAAIESKTVEAESVIIECRIKGFDRDAGVGKISSVDLPRVLKFVVPPERKLELQPKILRAMDDGVDTVTCEFLRVVDKSKQPTSLILIQVLGEDDRDDDEDHELGEEEL